MEFLLLDDIKLAAAYKNLCIAVNAAKTECDSRKDNERIANLIYERELMYIELCRRKQYSITLEIL
jgi:hypothetical protein